MFEKFKKTKGCEIMISLNCSVKHLLDSLRNRLEKKKIFTERNDAVAFQ